MKLNLPQASINQDTLENPVYIVNLSTIHRLLSVSEVLDNFAQLHYDYAKSWLHFEWYSKLWVGLKYLSMKGPLNDYNLGKIDTASFITQLQAIFSFLPPAESAELLKETWNSLIIWDKSDKNFNYLVGLQRPICFVSNTNELNIQKITQHFNFQAYKNISLYTSYENGRLKWDGLVEGKVDELKNKGYLSENIIFVSQYQSDLDKAKELGIKYQSASEFFPTSPVEIATPVIQSPSVVSNSGQISPSRSPASTFFVEKLEENQINSETTPLLTNQGP